MCSIKKKTKKERATELINRLFIFAKAQVSAFTGGMVDYAIMVFVTEVFHVHYTISIAIGGIIGAIVNFSLNKKWTFHSAISPYKSSGLMQFVKFAVVVCGSILLKSSGTYLITHYLHIDYKISRIMVDLTVSLAFNYILQKFWVFKKRKQELQPITSDDVVAK